MSNKVKFGLRNVHYALVTEASGILTYDTPVPLPGGVNLVLNPKGEKTEFYADDTLYYSATTNQGYEGTLELALIPDTFRTQVLGDIEDKNLALFENSNAVPKKIALLYEFQGDSKATRHVNYNVTVSRSNIESSAKTSSTEVKTEILNIVASPAIDTGHVKARLLQGQVGYDDFYTSVYEFEPVV